jgi:hypothetical protein
MVQFNAKVNVPVSLWDTKSGGAIGMSKTASSVNLSLDKICVQINSAYKEFSVLRNAIKTGLLLVKQV